MIKSFKKFFSSKPTMRRYDISHSSFGIAINGSAFSISFPAEIAADVVLQTFIARVAKCLVEENSGHQMHLIRQCGSHALTDLDMLHNSISTYWAIFEIAVCDSQDPVESRHLLFYSEHKAAFSVAINNAIGEAIEAINELSET